MQDKIKTEGYRGGRSYVTFRHEVKDLLNLDLREMNYSPPFEVCNLMWVLAFTKYTGKYFGLRYNEAWSMYLKHVGPIRKRHPYVSVEVTLSVICQKDERKTVTKDFATCLDLSSPALCGFEDFMFWKDLVSTKLGFFNHGNIIIQVKVAATPPQLLLIPKSLPSSDSGPSFKLIKEENDMLSTDKENIDGASITNEKEQLSLQERGEKLLTLGIGNNCKILVGKDASQKLFEANTLFLARISPVFENMFYGNMVENSPVLIPDIQPDIFYKLLLYSYTLKIQLNSQEEAADVYHVADKYLVKDLKEICLGRLWPSDGLDNWIPLRVAEIYNLPDLQDAVLQVMNKYIKEIVKTPEFMEISSRTLLHLVQMYTLPMDSELELFSAVLKWARAQCHRKGSPINGETLRAEIGDALCYIRFLSMTVDEFSGEPASCGVLTPEEQLSCILAIKDPKINLPPASLCSLKKKRCHIISYH